MLSEPPSTIFTVGHSTHPIDEFVRLLQSAGVEAIADVRRFPGSRRNPQFGATALREALEAHGIGYRGLGDALGGRRSSRDAASRRPRPDNSAWRSASFRAYADYMSEPEFEAGLAELGSLAAERRTAIMCAEAHPSRCHRQLIADALTTRGWRVCHLLADGRVVRHALSDHAQVRDGVLSYPGTRAEPLPGLD